MLSGQVKKCDDDASLLVQSSTILDEKMTSKAAEVAAAKQHNVSVYSNWKVTMELFRLRGVTGLPDNVPFQQKDWLF